MLFFLNFDWFMYRDSYHQMKFVFMVMQGQKCLLMTWETAYVGEMIYLKIFIIFPEFTKQFKSYFTVNCEVCSMISISSIFLLLLSQSCFTMSSCYLTSVDVHHPWAFELFARLQMRGKCWFFYAAILLMTMVLPLGSWMMIYQSFCNWLELSFLHHFIDLM